jgi:recombinase
VARIARALNETGVPCPSSADPGRNPHRSGTSWTLGTVTTILSNPRYTGRQVWNRQRTDKDLADPADVSLGHRSVQRWNLPDGWVISGRPAHPALVSEADFIAAQDINAVRGPSPGGHLAGPVRRRYLAVTSWHTRKQMDMGNYCVRDLNPNPREFPPIRGKSCRHSNGLMPIDVKSARRVFDM